MMIEVFVVVVMPAGGVSQTSAIVAFFIVTIGAGAGKSYLEATCYALVSAMPPKFMSAVMFGCGFSGVVASTLQCIIKASMPDTYESALIQSYIYFSLALAIMGIALCMALCLRYNSFAQRHVGEFRNLASAATLGEGTMETEPVADGNGVFEGDVVLDDQAARAEGAGGKKASGEIEEEEEEVRELRAEVEEVGESRGHFTDQHLTTSQQLQRTRVKPVFKLIYPMQIACFCIFFVSLFIFPSLIIPIDRTDKWFATLAILIYNCGDATGRLSSSIKKIWPSRRVLLIVSLCRFIFFPLIFLCIYKYIPGHTPAYIILGSLGLTKGFFGATSMVFGPNTPGLQTEGQRVMAGQLMGISLLAGASVSALLALLVVLFLP
ncbi:solute carrier family 29 (equilibrative nucleoside transporter), member 1/2/3 [Strigomonas culicis]|nr:solute carrier family 29 (equilibrative nucleoside transporter), member 1/2/3 [Strigomonas culicis]|eukprot:EPY21808.1 solute carrier family 29 (equilibrative nucleoside transporter), member 1/2/3 [Strigomonas culicis]